MDDRRCAVVLGGSLSGLATAALLARTFERVVLIERDALGPDADGPTKGRKGVPQGRHNHNLSPLATRVLDHLFPRALDALRARGVTVCDPGADGRWITGGVRLARARVGHAHVLVTRPCLDAILLAQLRDLPNVSVRDGTDACGLVVDRERRVTDVRLVRRDDGVEERLGADLVIDASGRGSRLPRWLADLGFDPPAEESIDVKVTYATRLFRRRPGDLEGDRFVFMSSRAPDLPRGGVAFAVEDDRWMVLLFGYGEPRPPVDLAGFVAFAKTLPAPDIGELVEHAEPLCDGAPFTFPRSTRRRYDRAVMPRGVVAIGDALSSTNPSWGLGITSLALQLEALEAHLDGPCVRAPELQVELLRASSRIWDDVAANDRALDAVPGRAPAPRRLLRHVIEVAIRGAAHDPELSAALLSVIGYVGSPLAVLRPDRLLRAFLWPTARAVLPRPSHA